MAEPMSSHVNDAFRRAAARGGPLYRSFYAFRQVLDEYGRIDPGRFDWMFAAPGAVRWRDDEDKGEQGERALSFNGVVTLFCDYEGQPPDLLQDAQGQWLLVISGLERDSLGAGLRLHVQRWTGDAPSIRAGAP